MARFNRRTGPKPEPTWHKWVAQEAYDLFVYALAVTLVIGILLVLSMFKEG